MRSLTSEQAQCQLGQPGARLDLPGRHRVADRVRLGVQRDHRAVTRRRMHEAGAGVFGDVVAGNSRYVEVPVAVGTRKAAEGVRGRFDHDRQDVLVAVIALRHARPRRCPAPACRR